MAVAEDQPPCLKQRRAQARIDAAAAGVQQGGHVAAAGALAEADGDAVTGQCRQGFGRDGRPALLPGGKCSREGGLDQGVVLQIGALRILVDQAMRGPGMGIRRAAFGAIHKS